MLVAKESNQTASSRSILIRTLHSPSGHSSGTMKLSLATSLVFLFGATNALPQPELEKRADPDLVPVTLGQFPSTSFTCGIS